MIKQASPSFRMKQIDELIFRHLSMIIFENIEFPDNIVFTLTRVLTTKDLNYAKIFYICNPEEKHPQVANLLKKKLKDIKELLANDIILRKMPQIKFIFDKKESDALKMDTLIGSLK